MSEANELFELESEIVRVLKNVFDPEIPVNIYDLGLIYEIDVADDRKVEVIMTLTAPNCPMADQLLEEVNEKVSAIDGITGMELKLVFDPPWEKDMMTEAARLDLGLL